MKHRWTRENVFKSSRRSSTWSIKWETRLDVVHRLRLIIVSGRTTRTRRSDGNLFRHDQTLSIRRRETRTKEILLTVKICLVDAPSSDVSRGERNVHRGQWCDHCSFQSDERHMTGKEDSHRGPAIRALCKITDVRLRVYLDRGPSWLIVVDIDDAEYRTIHETSDCRSTSFGFFGRFDVVDSSDATKSGDRPTMGQRSSRSRQSREHHDSIPCSRSALSDLSNGQTRHSKSDRQVLQRRSSKSLRLLFSRQIISANLSPLVSVFRFALPLVWSTKKAKGNDERERERKLFSSVSFCRTNSPMYDFIDSCLRNKNDMLIYEAAATIVSLKCITSKELRSAINILPSFLPR